MRLTLYTDYTLRVMMYLTVKHAEGGVATIDEMADAYAISRSNLTKIVHELAQNGFILTTRGRAGGACLARPPAQISIGELVRMAEKDFAIVECHAAPQDVKCAIMPACNLKMGLRRAVDAFLRELDQMTLEDAVRAPAMAASLLRIGPPGIHELAVPLGSVFDRNGRLARRAPRAAGPARRATTRLRRSRPN